MSDSAKTLARIDRAIVAVARGFLVLAAGACAAVFALVFLAVVMRYVAQAPFRFSDELAGLLLAAIVFLGMPFAFAAHQNIRVTLLTERLPRNAARVFWVIGQVVTVAFCALVAWDAWKITAFTIRLGLKSEQARLPLTPWLILFTAAFAVCAAIAVWQMIRPPPAQSGSHLT